LIDNENDYLFIRSHLLNKYTITEYQIAARIAKTIDPDNKDTVNNPLIEARLANKSKWLTNLIIHYTHESRLESYNTKICVTSFQTIL
jgi:hypothetical protein